MDTPRSDECLALLRFHLPLNKTVRVKCKGNKERKATKVMLEQRCVWSKEMHEEIFRRWCVCIPVMCRDRTSVKSGLKLPPSNTSHPSVAMRPAITGALPPTAHRFPGRSREASTSSLKRVSFSTKRLQDRGHSRTILWLKVKTNYNVLCFCTCSDFHLSIHPSIPPTLFLLCCIFVYKNYCKSKWALRLNQTRGTWRTRQFV